jgi:hypothetical protein
MTVATAVDAATCPVAAIFPELAGLISERNGLGASAGDRRRDAFLAARENAIVARAETAAATSLGGAAFQCLLLNRTATAMGVELERARAASDSGRTVGASTKAADRGSRSVFTALAAHGFAVPKVIFDAYSHLTVD